MKRLDYNLWWVVAVLFLAALLRIYNLNLQGLWGDEGWSVEFSEPRDPAAITRNMIDDLHPPLYFILLGGWRELAGSDEVAMRLLAVFAALITVALIYRIGRKLFDISSGIMAGLILALADKHILLSQEVRHYPMAFMWIAASSLVFLYWLDNPSRRNTLTYAIIYILAVYTHYYTSLILLVQLAYAILFLRPWSRVFKLGAMMGLASLAFLPWLPIAIHQLQIRPEGILHSYSLSVDTLKIFTVDFLGRPVALFIALMIVGVVSLNQAGRLIIRHNPGVWYAVIWFALPVALTIAIFDYVTLLTDRNMALLILPIALLGGHGITAFRPTASILLALLITFNGMTSLDSYSDHPPWREMADFVANNYPPGEPVLMDVRGGDKALGYHLRKELPAGTEIISLNQWEIKYKIHFLGVLQSFLQDNDGFWVAYWGDPEYQRESYYTGHGYTRTASHTEYHLGFPIVWYHYDKLPPLDERLGVYNKVISLHKVKLATAGKPGEELPVSLWWSTAKPLDTSYSISVFLLDDAGRLVAQHDGPPQNGDRPTNTWEVDTIIFDSHEIPLPESLPPGTYQLAVKVYNSANGEILPVNNHEEYLTIQPIHIQ
ncbi:MAG: glycosyltransferase family 39 protein [Chloroflexi bacterium]|nr:glycosyltransferase family 39 protein [Chloroflexota bacterium]